MVNPCRRHLGLFEVAILIAAWAGACIAAHASGASSVEGRLFTLTIAEGNGSQTHLLYRYGVPFAASDARAANGPIHADVDATISTIYLLGMTETMRSSAWSDAASYASRFFVGDKLGKIRLRYADGSTQDFPLIMGESVWWGLPFYQTREPFPGDARLRAAFENVLRLYPATPIDDGNYVAVIKPKGTPLASIEIIGSTEKRGSVHVAGITVETAPGTSIARKRYVPVGDISPGLVRFATEKPLRPQGFGEKESAQRLEAFKRVFYTTDADFKRLIAPQIPRDYTGPHVTFRGTPYAEALQNAFYANVQDMLDKVDADGTYHTSTRNALSWAGVPWSAGGEFGTFRKDVGVYYNQAWSRDLGRSLQELTELDYFDKASHTADFAFASARTWTDNAKLSYKGLPLPPHWSRVINHPDFAQPFENDGHGLISLFIYKLWQREPEPNTWLRAHWADVKFAGDWIPWQFDHASITGAKDGVLYTTGESADGKGYSVYPDTVCMDALLALAQMADSIDETQSAALWRARAEKMRVAIPARYLIDDPKYGRVWTLADAGWPNKSTVLGPLIFVADARGFAPEDDDPAWRPANEAAYQRLVDTYHPFGFYGWAMGYGQGFVTQSALLLDRMKDATTMLNWTARELYDPQIHSFVVPEGAQVDPSGRYIYRTGDQGNGVQEAEIVKALRILIGVDDVQPNRLRIMPRLPYGWSEMAIDKYPALVEKQGRRETAHLHYDLHRAAAGMSLAISSDLDLGMVAFRLGPFENQPQPSDVLVNGGHPANPVIEKSGDSWWVGFEMPVTRATHQ